MKSFFSIIIICTLAFRLSYSQSTNITTSELEKIRNSFKLDDAMKMRMNAVSGNEIKKLAINREVVGKTDHFFKYKVKTAGITDQKSSGRCWMFTGLNVLRPKVIEKYQLENFEFSSNYLYFYDQLEKANLFLQMVIDTRDKKMDDRQVEWLFKNPIGDGGIWNLFADLVPKYGLVPKEIMPETTNSESTSVISSILSRKLKEFGLELRRSSEKGLKINELLLRKTEMLGVVYQILVVSLGIPPTQFSWRFKDKSGNISAEKTYTPQSFFQEATGINFDDYIQLMDDPSRPYYQLYEIELDRNLYDGKNWKFINIPSSEIKKFAQASIIDNEALYFSCDVGKFLNSSEGVLSLENYDYESLFGVKFGMNKKDRILTFDSGSSHGMALIGFDPDENGNPAQWLLENSWGNSSGHNGYLCMTDKWFDEYMFRIVVNKKYVDQKTLDLLKLKPVKLPPWDPMFMQDN